MDTHPDRVMGRLIDDARAAAGLSEREAARRAGISNTRWKQIARGSHAPAGTAARMARAAGVTPGQLGDCRPDAAAVLADLLAADDEPTLPGIPPVSPAPAGTAVPAGADPAARIAAAVSAEVARIADEADTARLFAIEEAVNREIKAARDRGVPEGEIFSEPFERSMWLTQLTSEELRAAMVAVVRHSAQRRARRGNPGGPPVELAG